MEEIITAIIAFGVLVFLIVLAIIFKDKIGSALQYVGDLFKFGR